MGRSTFFALLLGLLGPCFRGRRGFGDRTLCRCGHLSRLGRLRLDGRRQHGDQGLGGLSDSPHTFRQRHIGKVDGVVDPERADVDLDELRDLRRQAFDLDLAKDRLQDPARHDARGLADEVERDRYHQPPREVDLVEVGVEDLARDGVTLHLAHEYHALVQPRICAVGIHEADQGGPLEVNQPPLDLLGLDAHQRKGALRPVGDRRQVAGAPHPARRALAGLAPAVDRDLDGFHAGVPQTKSELIEASSCVRRIASARSGATGRTAIFASSVAGGRSGMVSVTTSSASSHPRSGFTAGRDHTACVAHARTSGAPPARTASAAVHNVPAVSTMASTMTAARSSTSPMICISPTTLARMRRLSMMARCASRRLAKARARSTPPASGAMTVASRPPRRWRRYCRRTGVAYTLSTGTSKKPWICPAWRSTVRTREAPAVVIRRATSLALMGTRGATFRSWRAYP